MRRPCCSSRRGVSRCNSTSSAALNSFMEASAALETNDGAQHQRAAQDATQQGPFGKTGLMATLISLGLTRRIALEVLTAGVGEDVVSELWLQFRFFQHPLQHGTGSLNRHVIEHSKQLQLDIRAQYFLDLPISGVLHDTLRIPSAAKLVSLCLISSEAPVLASLRGNGRAPDINIRTYQPEPLVFL